MSVGHGPLWFANLLITNEDVRTTEIRIDEIDVQGLNDPELDKVLGRRKRRPIDRMVST